MSHTVRFVLALHNHQPIGNFTGVMEQAYQQSYRPFLDVFERYPTLKIALHTSGCEEVHAAPSKSPRRGSP